MLLSGGDWRSTTTTAKQATHRQRSAAAAWGSEATRHQPEQSNAPTQGRMHLEVGEQEKATASLVRCGESANELSYAHPLCLCGLRSCGRSKSSRTAMSAPASSAESAASSVPAVPAAAASPSSAASPTDGQLSFWQASFDAHSQSLLQCMLLHTDESEASDMNAGECAEILSVCAFRRPWVVNEWAAGMGRLTPLLASLVGFVYASDFVEAFCEQNREQCAKAHAANVQIDCIDAATYAPTAGGAMPHACDAFDFVFINWLLLYLDDAHAESFLRGARDSLKRCITPATAESPAPKGVATSAEKPGQSGWIFLHESCWERARESEIFAALPSSERARLLATPCEKTEDCQTYYRTSPWYESLFCKLGLEVVDKRELKVYAPVATWDQKGEVEQQQEGWCNRQRCWLLRIKQEE